MLKLQELMRRDTVTLLARPILSRKLLHITNEIDKPSCPQDKLAMNITMEQGKTLKDAQGDVFRGLGLLAILWYVQLL